MFSNSRILIGHAPPDHGLQQTCKVLTLAQSVLGSGAGSESRYPSLKLIAIGPVPRCKTSVAVELVMRVAIAGTKSADSGTSSPIMVQILSMTAFICLRNGLLTPNVEC